MATGCRGAPFTREDGLITAGIIPTVNFGFSGGTRAVGWGEEFMKGWRSTGAWESLNKIDHGIEDWGGLLSTEDYRELGRMMKQTAERLCQGRRFAILEGGYNHAVLGRNVNSFCEGFE